MDQAMPSLIPNSTCRSQGTRPLKVTQVRSKEKALFDKTDRDAQEIAEHINEICWLMWCDLFLVELGLGKHMTNLRQSAVISFTSCFHKKSPSKSPRLSRMAWKDFVWPCRSCAILITLGRRTDPPDPAVQLIRGLRRGYYARLGDPAGPWQILLSLLVDVCQQVHES